MLTWNKLGHGLLRSDQTKLGEWTIKPDSDHNDMARISFVPNLGKSFKELFDEANALDERLGDDKYNHPEFWLARGAYFSSDEIISVESLFEALHIVEYIESLVAPIPTWQETLDKLGFKKKYDPVQHPTLANVYTMQSNSKFSLSLGDAPRETMWLRYEPSGPRWHNLAVLDAVTKSHDGKLTIPHWWPQGFEAMDIMALIVERIILIRTTQRQHIRFKPTEEITHVG